MTEGSTTRGSVADARVNLGESGVPRIPRLPRSLRSIKKNPTHELAIEEQSALAHADAGHPIRTSFATQVRRRDAEVCGHHAERHKSRAGAAGHRVQCPGPRALVYRFVVV
jgi:hypothetical protein